jgi:hypothetical protein
MTSGNRELAQLCLVIKRSRIKTQTTIPPSNETLMRLNNIALITLSILTGLALSGCEKANDTIATKVRR